MKHLQKSSSVKGIQLLLASIMLISFSVSVSGQNKKARKADNYFLFSDYNKALPLYQALAEKNPTDVNYNYRLGVCYLYSNLETFKCLYYLEAAKANIKSPKDSIAELFYYIGNAYRMANRFNEAIQNYNIFKKLLKVNASNAALGKAVDIELEQCIDGNTMMESPTNARLTNLGPNVNSIYPDYAPAISSDESMLVFTSKRKECTGNKITPDGNYYEDIFLSRNTSDDWVSSKKLDSSFIKPGFFASLFASAKSIGKSINTNEHDASIALSPDGKKLYIYRFNDIWQSEYENGKWNKPTKLNKTIDGKRTHESSMSLTNDGNTLYFSSERDGGFGGKDLYVSVKQSDGTWAEPENLGPNINTELDEDAPYIESNSKTLYFSSQAHGSIGGYDVFKSKFEKDDWSVPENLGYPINSGADDIFFVYNTKQDKAFIASMRTDGIGNYDIYIINYVRPTQALFVTTYGNELKPLDLKKASLVNLKKNDSIRIALNQNSDFTYSGYVEQYKLTLPQYNNDSNSTVFEFRVPESYGLFNYFQEINYDIVENGKGQLIGYKTTVYNAFFDIEKELQKNKNRPSNLKKEEEYSAYIRTLPTNTDKLQVYSSINYIDTSKLMLLAVNNVKPSKIKPKDKVLSRNPNAFKTIIFDFSKSDLSEDAVSDIELVYNYLIENKDATMEIIGHTDSKGLDLFNTVLSKKRASEIMRYLIKKGIDAKRLKAIGMGESQPVAANENADGTDNPDGRRQNRRVEFVIVK